MRSLSLLIAPLSLLLLTSGCKKQRYDFDTLSPAHAAQAEIVLSVDKTGNGTVVINFEHLAPPQRIDKAFQSYVVWVQANEEKAPHKLGIVKYKEKARSGALEATFSDEEMTLIVTLEADTKVEVPTGTRVLEANVRAPKH